MTDNSTVSQISVVRTSPSILCAKPRQIIRHQASSSDVVTYMGAVTHRTPRSILVAEDDRGIRRLLELILRRADRDIIMASDGAEALRLTRLHQVDLLLVDVHMPRLDGTAFCRAYRERGGEAPVVMLSAASDGPAAARACAADGFIAKPFELATILKTVAHHLGTG
jgi:CheY-like chemotaxis protein